MVKKINGKKGLSPKGPKQIEPSQPISTGKISQTKEVNKTQQTGKSKRVRRMTRPMTASEREHLFNLIHEEADKMFGPNGLPEAQRNTVESAVKMAIDASIIEENEDSSS